MPVGLNFLFRVGRRLLAEPLENSGILPGKYYRSQALAALHEHDFPGCLRYLRLADPQHKFKTRMIAQVLILRCRLLREKHQRQLAKVEALCQEASDPDKQQRYLDILLAERQAIHYLESYIREAQELA